MKRPVFAFACIALSLAGDARADDGAPLASPNGGIAHHDGAGAPMCSGGTDPNGVLQECAVDDVGNSCAEAYGPSTCVAMTCWDEAGVSERDCAVCLPDALQLVDPGCAAGPNATCGSDGLGTCGITGGGSLSAYAPDCSVDSAYFASLACSDPSSDPGMAGGGEQSGSGSQERQCFDWSTGSPSPCPTSGCFASVAGFDAGGNLAGAGACVAAIACLALRKRGGRRGST